MTISGKLPVIATAFLLALSAFGCGSDELVTEVSKSTSCKDFNDSTEALSRQRPNSPEEKRESHQLFVTSTKLNKDFLATFGSVGGINETLIAGELSAKVRNFCESNPDATYGEALSESADSQRIARAVQEHEAEIQGIARAVREAHEGGDISPEAQQFKQIEEQIKQEKKQSKARIKKEVERMKNLVQP